MKLKTSDASRRPRNVQGDGPNWMIVAGGALLSTLSFHLLCKLKQGFSVKQPKIRRQNLKGSRNVVEAKQNSDNRTATGLETSLPLVTVLSPDLNKDNGVIWSTSPDRLELPQKPFHQSNSSESCVSESGSDFFSKREVVQKLRQQLKRRDDTILEMQDQIEILRNSYTAQLSHSSRLQDLIDSANRDLFDSEREIQRLRKRIADNCIGQFSAAEKPSVDDIWLDKGRTGHSNGYSEFERNLEAFEKLRGNGEKVELLNREVAELKELIDGKDYLLQSYKEQRGELTLKIKELQQRLDSQLPSIL